MASSPLLSIVIPVYNMRPFIEITLNSLAAQNHTDYEVIIVDDGSTDESLPYINDYVKEITEKQTAGQNLTNWQVISRENGGVSAARNSGLNIARGMYVMFIDGDDFMASNLVESISMTLSETSSDVLCWRYDVVNDNGQLITAYANRFSMISQKISGIDCLEKILITKELWIHTSSIAFRRSFLEDIQLSYTEGCISGEDQEFNYKALFRAESVQYIDKTLSYYVKREGSVTESHNIRLLDSVEALLRVGSYADKHSYLYDSLRMANLMPYIKQDLIIGNYMSNLQSYYLKTNMKVQYHIELIEQHYPMLPQKVKLLMLNYHGKNLKMRIALKVFLLFPNLYMRLYKIKGAL